MHLWIHRTTFFFFVLLFACNIVLGQSAIIKGYVFDGQTNEPIEFAAVRTTDGSYGSTTNSEGFFIIQNIPPGSYNVEASFLGYSPDIQADLEVSTAKPLELTFLLFPSAEQLDEVVVRVSPFERNVESPVSVRSIGLTEIQRSPGSNRDISKVVQSFPGVTTTASFRNDLLIRGGGPSENRFYIDGIEIPTINHFSTQGASGGPVGLLNIQFIKDVEFYSSAFPSSRGNALSSVFDFSFRDGRDDKIGGSFNLSATDIGISLEGPLTKKGTFLVSARRSYLQFLFDVLELPFLPTYNDFQAKLNFKFDERNELTILGVGAIDDFNLNLDANDSEEKQFLLDALPVAPQNSYTIGAVYTRFARKGTWKAIVSRNYLNNSAMKYRENDESSPDNLILDYNSTETENKIRLERTYYTGNSRWNFGVDYTGTDYFNRTFNRIYTSSGPETILFETNISFNRYGLFGQWSGDWFNDRFTTSFGLRLDGSDYSSQTSNPLDRISPRISLSYSISESFEVSANVGRYYQLPPNTVLGYKENGQLVNQQNGISYIQSNQAVLGFGWTTPINSRISIEGYFKSYSNYPFLLRDSISLANIGGDFGVVGNEPAIPSSKGRAYGIEFLYQQKIYKGFYGLLSYTVGWSEFQDKNENYIPSSWDARNILNLTLGKKLPNNWEIGVKWRYQGGLPQTPFSEASSLRQNWDVNFQGIPDFNRLNSTRLTASNTLDIRIDKKWFFEGWSLNVYADVQNITGNAVGRDELILDRPVDENGTPIGDGIIVNPGAPYEEQRYLLKSINAAAGSVIPSIGITLEF